MPQADVYSNYPRPKNLLFAESRRVGRKPIEGDPVHPSI